MKLFGFVGVERHVIIVVTKLLSVWTNMDVEVEFYVDAHIIEVVPQAFKG